MLAPTSDTSCPKRQRHKHQFNPPQNSPLGSWSPASRPCCMVSTRTQPRHQSQTHARVAATAVTEPTTTHTTFWVPASRPCTSALVIVVGNRPNRCRFWNPVGRTRLDEPRSTGFWREHGLTPVQSDQKTVKSLCFAPEINREVGRRGRKIINRVGNEAPKTDALPCNPLGRAPDCGSCLPLPSKMTHHGCAPHTG